MKRRIPGFLMSVGSVGIFFMSAMAAAQTGAVGATSEMSGAKAESNRQPTIAGKWNLAGNAGLANYTLEYGWPDTHQKAMGRTFPHQSVVVDPPDGKVPFVPWAKKIRDYHEEIHTDYSRMKSRDLDTQSKCYPSGVPRVMLRDAPLITKFDNSVVMEYEWAHQYRIIYTDGRPHIPGDLKLWYGDARGHWEGNTLVVDTTNNNGYSWLDVIGVFYTDDATVHERFTPLDAKTMQYDVTITDPNVYTRPWTMSWKYSRDAGGVAAQFREFVGPENYEIWEHACNEGAKKVDLPMH